MLIPVIRRAAVVPSERNHDGNRLEGDVTAIDSRNCFVRGTERRLVGVGPRRLVIVDTPDAGLVARARAGGKATGRPDQDRRASGAPHHAKQWVIVPGAAEITRNEEVFLMAENESTYLLLSAVHRLRNPGKVPLN